MIVAPVTAQNIDAARAFLEASSTTALLLLSSLQTYGPTAGESMNSGNFKCLMLDDNIHAVFCLTGRSTLLIETAGRTDLDAAIVDAVTAERLPLKGVLGEWHSALAVWQRLLEKGAIVERYNSRELLYEVALPPLDEVGSESDNVRLLRPEDFLQWRDVRMAFLAEEGLPVQGTLDQQRTTFEEQTAARRYWGYFEEGQLLATVALNATYKDTGQVGGVFTVPQRRREGLSRWAMRSLFADSIRLHGLSKLVLFTGQNNQAAQRLYESLDFKQIGEYALLFGDATRDA